MVYVKKLSGTLFLIAALIFAMIAGPVYAGDAADTAETALEYEEVFSQWDPDAPALNVLIDYVESVTDETSPDYIPPVDRIAVFDMDGTVYGEMFPTYLELYMAAWRILKDPDFEPDEEMLAMGREIRESVISGSYAENFTMRYTYQAARAYAGMTLTEFADFVTEILLMDVDGFEGMTYGEAFYLPMIEIVEYLQDNDFKVYIVSGSDRLICRTLIEGVLDIPYENIIGSDVLLTAAGQGDTDGLYYEYSADDEVVRTDTLLNKNVKMNKVSQIAQEIGRQPVLSFGNSSGDISMLNYTLNNNRYKSAAFMLIPDDEERDYGDTRYGEQIREVWEEYGYNVISIKNDFKTIYGENVKRTGHFRWVQEFRSERN